MSVRVTIDIAGGAAHRTLIIENLTKVGNRRDPDEESLYCVERYNSPDGGGRKSATFTHRYGDDVTVLIAKAGEALRKQHGHV